MNTQTKSNISRVVILGGGTAGWMAANLFAKKLGEKVRVTVVESPDIGIIGVGEGSTPTLKRFFDIMDIDEQQWMPQCNATYKTSIRFSGWSTKPGFESYQHPFFSQVDTFTGRAFRVNCRTRRLGLATHTSPGDFFLNGVLAKQHKQPLVPEHFPFRMEYGYHFDSHALGQFLATHGATLGVTHLQAKVLGCEQDNDCNVTALHTDKGQVSGELFIDCSGFRGILTKQALSVPFVSFKDNLFNDAAVVAPTAKQPTLPVETHAVAMKNGWCWHIPLRHRTGNGYVYSKDFTSRDNAETEFRQYLGLDDNDEVKHLDMNVGRLARQWEKNVVAVGLSQGFIEPLEATALHLVQICIEQFLLLWEKGGFTDIHRAEYNQKVAERFEHVRDYIVAHYKLNSRNDTEYWQQNRDNPHASKSLAAILNTWFKREDLDEEIARQQLQSHFDTNSWHCLLAGYGSFPPLAPNQPDQGDLYKEQEIESFLSRCALNFSQQNI